MYNVTDLNNIILSKEDCIALKGDKICNAVKKGNFKFSGNDIILHETIKYLFTLTMTDCVENILVQQLNKTCDDCNSTQLVGVSTVNVDNIITEDNNIIEEESNTNTLIIE